MRIARAWPDACLSECTMPSFFFARLGLRAIMPLPSNVVVAVLVLTLLLRVESHGSDHLIRRSHLHDVQNNSSDMEISRFAFVPDHLRALGGVPHRALAVSTHVTETRPPINAVPLSTGRRQMFLAGPNYDPTIQTRPVRPRRKRLTIHPASRKQISKQSPSGLIATSKTPLWALRAFQSTER